MSLLYTISTDIPLWQYSFKRLNNGDIKIENLVSREIVTLDGTYGGFVYDSMTYYFRTNGRTGDHIPWFHSIFEIDGDQYLLLSGLDTSVAFSSAFLNTSPVPLKALSVKADRILDSTDDLFNEVPTTYWTRDLHLGDVNGDGVEDLFISNQGREIGSYLDAPNPRINPVWGENNNLLLGSLNGWQDASHLLPRTVDFSHGSSIADLNGDGFNEIVVNNLGSFDELPNRYILQWSGSELVFADTPRLFAEEESSWTLSGDLNRDGVDDIVIGNKVFWGARGSFGSDYYDLPITVNQRSGFVNWHGGAIADVNGDNLLDIIKISASDGRESSGLGAWGG